MNKKAVHQNIVAGLITGIFVIIILSVFALRYTQTVNENNQRISCEQSVRQAATRGFFSSKFGDTLVCPTKDVVIKENPSLVQEQEIIKKYLANELVDAWNIYGKGELQLFENEGTFCTIHALISFEEKEKKIFGFMQYLKEEKMPLTENTKGQSLSYLDYLMPYKSEHAALIGETQALHPAEDQIDTNKNYAVYFAYASQQNDVEKMRTLMNENFVGKIKAVTAGQDQQWISFVVLDEYDENILSALGCESLPVSQNQKPII